MFWPGGNRAELVFFEVSVSSEFKAQTAITVIDLLLEMQVFFLRVDFEKAHGLTKNESSAMLRKAKSIGLIKHIFECAKKPFFEQRFSKVELSAMREKLAKKIVEKAFLKQKIAKKKPLLNAQLQRSFSGYTHEKFDIRLLAAAQIQNLMRPQA